jgi:hypothetical protein
MKSTRFSSTVIALLMAFWTSNATALPGPMQIETIHFDLVLGQQGLDGSNSSPNTCVATVNSVRITDKDLLNFLADAFRTNWPDGAQLALFNFGNIGLTPVTHVCVVDITGTNLIVDATTGINIGGTNIAFFSFGSDNPVGAGKAVTNPARLDTTACQIVTFRLHRLDLANINTDTDLNFQGLDISHYNYDRHTGISCITDHASFYGDGQLNAKWSVLAGEMTGTLNWKTASNL